MAAAGLGGVLWQRAAARLRALRVAAPLGARAGTGELGGEPRGGGRGP